jgi:hypothetical protein
MPVLNSRFFSTTYIPITFSFWSLQVHSSLYHKCLSATICALLVISSAHAAQTEGEKPEQKTHTVSEEPLKIDITLSGTAVAEEMTEVAITPHSWSTWTVEEAVAHGVHVRK